MLLEIKHLYVVLCSLGGLQENGMCNFDHFENCGFVDKSSSASRWAIVAEEYRLGSTSELQCSNVF